MAQTNFRSLQNRHDALLRKQQDLSEASQPEFLKEVKVYIEEAKQGGSYVAASRERDQLRANLRYWANYIYSVEKNFPDTDLAPAAVPGRSPWATIGGVIGIGLGLLLLAGFFLNLPNAFSNTPPATEVPVDTSTAVIVDASPTLPDVQATEPPTEPPIATSISGEPDVVLTSPQNGDNVLPSLTFEGTYSNLNTQTTVHVLLIRNDRVYPVPEPFSPPSGSTAGTWEIEGALYRNPEELAQAELVTVVPGVCLDQLCRDAFVQSLGKPEGLALEELPSQFSFKLFTSSTRSVYRNAYEAIMGIRLVYSKMVKASSGQQSYDLYSSNPDGTEERAITNLTGIDEKFPSLSPNGRQIVYVQIVNATNAQSIHIMDSSGENDREIISVGKNYLETPQWSPDGQYIAYALGDTSQRADITYWSILVHNLDTEQADTEQDVIISGKPGPHILNRYFSWMPNADAREIVFNGDTSGTLESGILKVSIDAPEEAVLFYDAGPNEVQPHVTEMGDGYLLTFTIIDNRTFEHEIYAILDPDRELPLEGTPVKLIPVSKRAILRDYPKVEPKSNLIYYINSGNIYKVAFLIEQDTMTPLRGTIEDGEAYGDLVVQTGSNSGGLSFDLQYMEAYFPLAAR